MILCPEQVVQTEPLLNQNEVATFIFVLSLLVIIGIFEYWALRTKHRTISQLSQRLAKAFKWFRIVGLAILGFLGFHLFFEWMTK